MVVSRIGAMSGQNYLIVCWFFVVIVARMASEKPDRDYISEAVIALCSWYYDVDDGTARELMLGSLDELPLPTSIFIANQRVKMIEGVVAILKVMAPGSTVCGFFDDNGVCGLSALEHTTETGHAFTPLSLKPPTPPQSL